MKNFVRFVVCFLAAAYIFPYVESYTPAYLDNRWVVIAVMGMLLFIITFDSSSSEVSRGQAIQQKDGNRVEGYSSVLSPTAKDRGDRFEAYVVQLIHKEEQSKGFVLTEWRSCLLYTSPSPRDA